MGLGQCLRTEDLSSFRHPHGIHDSLLFQFQGIHCLILTSGTPRVNVVGIHTSTQVLIHLKTKSKKKKKDAEDRKTGSKFSENVSLRGNGVIFIMEVTWCLS